MVTFKECQEKDTINVFFNDNEFAEEALINGKEMLVIFDDELLQKNNASGEGLVKGELLFHAYKSQFEDKPFVGKRMKVNKTSYEISNMTDGKEMYTITLVRNRT